MLDSVRNYLSEFGPIGKSEEKILETMKIVDRKNFMLDEFKNSSYLNMAIPSGFGQTISQPSTVARMLQLLDLKKGNKVLEIGTGSGWNASLICHLVGSDGRVLSLEVVQELIKKSKERIRKNKIFNVEIKDVDFRDLKESFDKIIFTAGIEKSQERKIEDFARKHLNNGGICVCPHISGSLIVFKRGKNVFTKEYTKDNYVFVPLVIN